MSDCSDVSLVYKIVSLLLFVTSLGIKFYQTAQLINQ